LALQLTLQKFEATADPAQQSRVAVADRMDLLTGAVADIDQQPDA
jgi:hypothetical protein